SSSFRCRSRTGRSRASRCCCERTATIAARLEPKRRRWPTTFFPTTALPYAASGLSYANLKHFLLRHAVHQRPNLVVADGQHFDTVRRVPIGHRFAFV